MSSYTNLLLTNKGVAYLAQSLATPEDVITFISAASSDQQYEESAVAGMVEITGIKKHFDVLVSYASPDKVSINCTITNKDNVASYELKTVGYFIKDFNSADPEALVLFGVVLGVSPYDIIPGGGTQATSIGLRATLISSVTTITSITIDMTSYVNIPTFDEYSKRTDANITKVATDLTEYESTNDAALLAVGEKASSDLAYYKVDVDKQLALIDNRFDEYLDLITFDEFKNTLAVGVVEPSPGTVPQRDGEGVLKALCGKVNINTPDHLVNMSALLAFMETYVPPEKPLVETQYVFDTVGTFQLPTITNTVYYMVQIEGAGGGSGAGGLGSWFSFDTTYYGYVAWEPSGSGGGGGGSGRFVEFTRVEPSQLANRTIVIGDGGPGGTNSNPSWPIAGEPGQGGRASSVFGFLFSQAGSNGLPGSQGGINNPPTAGGARGSVYGVAQNGNGGAYPAHNQSNNVPGGVGGKGGPSGNRPASAGGAGGTGRYFASAGGIDYRLLSGKAGNKGLPARVTILVYSKA